MPKTRYTQVSLEATPSSLLFTLCTQSLSLWTGCIHKNRSRTPQAMDRR
ncbi:hypothetical protein MNBD_GAMMA11-1856 [hydrothermal vent metagenome]|uniref:Uncharacterized protein n=1 Tax=hydrothermal vent metagenome TaxID=652676 RepID=A0A3B0XGJ6_9ZZZZ